MGAAGGARAAAGDDPAPRDRRAGIDDRLSEPAASVVVVSIGSPGRLAGCLNALARQTDAPDFEVIVAHDRERLCPELEDRPGVWTVAGAPTPPALAAAGARAARGAVVLLTEDPCVPDRGWVRALHDAARRPGVGAAGGPVAAPPNASPFDWAFHVTDFAAHLPPVPPGPVDALSVCNVAYPRSALTTVEAVWAGGLHETRLHDAIRRRVGPLVRVPGAVVESRRRVRPAAALRERFAFGRLYGALGFAGRPVWFRVARGLADAALPALLAARAARAGRRAGVPLARLAQAAPAIGALAVAWSAGEAVGTVTGRPPREARAAPEREGAR